MHGRKMTDNEHKLKKREVQIGCKEKFFAYKDSPAMEQDAHRGCAVSFPGFQHPTV